MNEATEYIIILTILVWVVWDIAIVFTWRNKAAKKKNETISQKIIRWSKKLPVIPLGAGMLIGHWWL